MTVRDPTYGEQFENISKCCLWYLKLSVLGHWMNSKNDSPLQSTVHERIKKNRRKLVIFNKKKCIFHNFLGSCLLIFSKMVLCRRLCFLRCEKCPKTLKLALENTFKFFTIRGDPYCQKVTQSRKKGWNNNIKKIKWGQKIEQENGSGVL